MDHLVITSRRHENDVLAYGPFPTLEQAQSFMRKLANQIDDCLPQELEENYHIETDNFFIDITTISNPETLEG